MGYSTREHRFGTIRSYWPDDDEDTIYIAADAGCGSMGERLADIIETVKNKWPDVSLEDVHIASENIHTDCLNYDLYDAGDYTNFIVITRDTEHK